VSFILLSNVKIHDDRFIQIFSNKLIATNIVKVIFKYCLFTILILHIFNKLLIRVLSSYLENPAKKKKIFIVLSEYLIQTIIPNNTCFFTNSIFTFLAFIGQAPSPIHYSNHMGQIRQQNNTIDLVF